MEIVNSSSQNVTLKDAQYLEQVVTFEAQKKMKGRMYRYGNEVTEQQYQKAKKEIEEKKLERYIPWFVIHSRYTPEEAAYWLWRWLNFLESNQMPEISFLDTATIVKLKNILSDRVRPGKTGKPEWPNYYYMKNKFRPIPPFPHVNLNAINKILSEADEETIKGINSIEDLYLLTTKLENLCGVSESNIHRYRERRRKGEVPTKSAVYNGLHHQQRKEKLHSSLWHYRKYNRALSQAGRLRGRIQNFFKPFVTRTCAKLDKSGLVTVKIDQETALSSDVPTMVFIALCTAEFSVRKGFTLDSQQHGGLEKHLKQILDSILSNSSTTRWGLIATIYPMQNILNRVNQNNLNELLSSWLKMQIPVSKFLKEQWDLGVSKCAEKGMMVPRSGTTKVDSAGWNVVCGAWNNFVRFTRAIYTALGKEPPVLIKCMKLLAADQMEWASMVGKEEEKDIKVFLNLVHRGITCWDIVLGLANCTKEIILKACQEEGVQPKKWLGVTQERTKETTETKNMICGVPVGSEAIVMDILKTLGAFGYKPYSNS